jgi:alpha,alpha-trehalase
MSKPVSSSPPVDPWFLEYEGYDPDAERLREALCTVGNGLFASRGAAPECSAGGPHYPGTYVAGLYDRRATEIAGQEIVNESIVNVPNWLPLTFSIGDGPWFTIDDVEVLEYRQTLELRRGILVRRFRFRDREHRETTVSQRRLVHMDLAHVAALETTIRPENWSGSIVVRSVVDGGVENEGVPRYSELAGDHLVTLDRVRLSDDTVALRSRTVQSRIEIAEAARLRAWADGDPFDLDSKTVEDDDVIGLDFRLEIAEGNVLRVEKVVTLHTSRDHAISEPWVASVEALDHAGDFAELEPSHVLAWDELWRRFDIDLGSGTEPASSPTSTSSTSSRPPRRTRSTATSGSRRAACTARRTGATSSGTSSSCSRC